MALWDTLCNIQVETSQQYLSRKIKEGKIWTAKEQFQRFTVNDLTGTKKLAALETMEKVSISTIRNTFLHFSFFCSSSQSPWCTQEGTRQGIGRCWPLQEEKSNFGSKPSEIRWSFSFSVKNGRTQMNLSAVWGISKRQDRKIDSGLQPVFLAEVQEKSSPAKSWCKTQGKDQRITC